MGNIDKLIELQIRFYYSRNQISALNKKQKNQGFPSVQKIQLENKNNNPEQTISTNELIMKK